MLPEQAAETRDLKGLIDNLRKELERKDSRNDKLSKDMVSLRTTLSNHEVNQSSVSKPIIVRVSILSHHIYRFKICFGDVTYFSERNENTE